MTSTCRSGGSAAKSREILLLAAYPKVAVSRRRRMVFRITANTIAGRDPFCKPFIFNAILFDGGDTMSSLAGHGTFCPMTLPAYAAGARCTKNPLLASTLLKCWRDCWRDPDRRILSRGCLPQVRALRAPTAELGTPGPD